VEVEGQRLRKRGERGWEGAVEVRPGGDAHCGCGVGFDGGSTVPDA
jgi:hypothetical protein